MRYVLSIDPAMTTGVAVVGYESKGPPVHIESFIVKLPAKERFHWHKIAMLSVADVLNRLNGEEVQWVIESWSHHRNFRDAIRLAQVQQAWIDVASALSSDKDPVLYNVNSWQAAIGAGAIKSKIHGKNARKKHAQVWAKSSYKINGDLKHDIADALCMASVWIIENRNKQSTFRFNKEVVV
jgi:Holliday junction resolvasome RuvABC endonuclease subunit